MTRHQAREQAFCFLFEKIFNDADLDEIIDSAMLARDIEANAFSKRIFYGVEKHLEQIDDTIESNSRKWKKDRMSKVVLAVLRLAVYEMLYENTPPAVSINEAVELTKVYATKGDASFVNGVLSGVCKSLKKNKEEENTEKINGDIEQ